VPSFSYPGKESEKKKKNEWEKKREEGEQGDERYHLKRLQSSVAMWRALSVKGRSLLRATSRIASRHVALVVDHVFTP